MADLRCMPSKPTGATLEVMVLGSGGPSPSSCSEDTTLAGDGVARLAKGADLFVANATVLDPPAAPPALYALHASPTRIGEVARDAGVRAVVLAHVTPTATSHEDEVIRSVKRAYAGPVALARDCLRVRADGR